MKLEAKLWCLWMILLAGNCLWALYTGDRSITPVEHTYFEGIALLLVYFWTRLEP